MRGIAVHSAIGQFYKHRLHRCSNIDLTELKETVIDLFRDEWARYKKGALELKLTQEELDFFAYGSQKMMVNFLYDFIKDHGFEAPKPTLEKTLFCKKYLLLGRIDAIHNSRDPPLIVDYKTCKSKELTDDYKRQLAIYTLLYQENFKTKPNVGIHFVKFANGLKTYTVSDAYLDKIKELILEIHDKTESENIEDYPCKCGWCNKNYYTAKL